jgi:hypothetical protein
MLVTRMRTSSVALAHGSVLMMKVSQQLAGRACPPNLRTFSCTRCVHSLQRYARSLRLRFNPNRTCLCASWVAACGNVVCLCCRLPLVAATVDTRMHMPIPVEPVPAALPLEAAVLPVPAKLSKKGAARGPNPWARGAERVLMSAKHRSNMFDPAILARPDSEGTWVAHDAALKRRQLAADGAPEDDVEADREYWNSVLDAGKVCFCMCVWVCARACCDQRRYCMNFKQRWCR